MTQSVSAKAIETTPDELVLILVEDADYGGHSLATLRRIAAALDQRVEIRFVPIRRTA